jgi:hypothetical protein
MQNTQVAWRGFTTLARSKPRCEAALFDEEPIQGLAFGSEPPILRRKTTCSLRLMISRLRAALPCRRAAALRAAMPLPLCRPFAQRRFAVRAPWVASR